MADVTLTRQSPRLILTKEGTVQLALTKDEHTLTLGTNAGSPPSPKLYTTAVALLAATPADGTIGFALDTHVHYLYQNGTWSVIPTSTYVDAQDVATLAAAEAYAAAHDATTLAFANSHSDTNDAVTLASANSHADTGDAATLASANAHSDANDATGSNVGSSGVGVFKQKNGTSLQFKKVDSSDGTVVITDDTANDRILLSVINTVDQVMTKEALAITCDPSGVTITSGTILTSQAEITAYLASAGGSAFKYLKEVWDALPPIIAHSVTITMNAGVHRPRATGDTSVAWSLQAKSTINGAVVTIAGPSVASWTQIVAAATITAHQTASGNPYIDVSGTPYTGLNLKGYFAVIGTATYLIHDHTSSRLYVTAALSPAPTDNVSTVKVMRPAAELRNSLDDVSKVSNWLMLIDQGMPGGPLTMTIQDVLFNPFGLLSIGVRSQNSFVFMNRCVYDLILAYDTYGKDPQGISYSVVSSGLMFCIACSVRDSLNNGDGPFSVSNRAFMNVNSCYFSGSKDPAFVAAGGTLFFANTVFDRIGSTSTQVVTGGIQINGTILAQDSTSAKLSEIRNQLTGMPGLCMDGGHLDAGDVDDFVLCFKNNAGPCVRFTEAASMRLDTTGSKAGLIDLGGNTDVGLEFKGNNNSISVGSPTTVTGALGAIRFADGDLVAAWSDITSPGSARDQQGNIVRRA